MPTNFPHVEERLRGILDMLVEEAEFVPSGQLRGSWISGAREYVDNVNEDAGLARRAVRYMRQRGLIIKSPRSLIAVALDLKRKPDNQSEAGRRRYAESVEAYCGPEE